MCSRASTKIYTCKSKATSHLTPKRLQRHLWHKPISSSPDARNANGIKANHFHLVSSSVHKQTTYTLYINRARPCSPKSITIKGEKLFVPIQVHCILCIQCAVIYFIDETSERLAKKWPPIPN